MVFLLCMDEHESDMLIKEIHEGSFGIHSNRHTMAKKILIVGYYWLTTETNCFKYLKKCHKSIYMQINYMFHLPPECLNCFMVVLHIGNRYNRNDRAKSYKWTLIHPGCHRLLHQIGGNCILRQCDEISDYLVH